MNKIPILSYALKNPDKACPVRGFEMALQDLSVDGVELFALVISRKQFNADYYTEEQRVALGLWITNTLMPQLNQYARVVLSVLDAGINDHEGSADFA